jgi:hypothetical protein
MMVRSSAATVAQMSWVGIVLNRFAAPVGDLRQLIVIG